MASGGVSVTDQAVPSGLKVIGTDSIVPFQTTLTAATTVGATSISVASINGFAPGMSLTAIDGPNPEVFEISGTWDGQSLTVPIRTGVQFAHASGVAIKVLLHVQIISIGDPTNATLRAAIDPDSGGLKVAIVAGGDSGGGSGGVAIPTMSSTWTSGIGWSNPAPPANGIIYGVTIVNPGAAAVRLNDSTGAGAIPLWIYQANEPAGEADAMPVVGKTWATGLNWSGVSNGLVVTVFYGLPATQSVVSNEQIITLSDGAVAVPGRTGSGTLYGVLVSSPGTGAGGIQDGNGNVLFVYQPNVGPGDVPLNCPKPYSNGLFSFGAASGNPTLVLTVV